MPSAAAIREQIESVLAMRIPAALSVLPRSAPELLPTGIAEVDTMLGGGLPLGGVTEIIGPVCSGRSTLVLSVLAGITGQGAAGAYVDVSDALDPLSAAAMGVDLGRLLWVRAGSSEEIPRLSVTDKRPLEVRTRSMQDEKYGRGGSHPRTEMRGIEHAVEKLFQPKDNPENAEIPLFDYSPRCAESVRGRRVARFPMSYQNVDRQTAQFTEPVAQPKNIATERSPDPKLRPFQKSERRSAAKEVWDRLDQGLRATDLLLNTGGFRAIVIDMGDVSPEQARRVPLASWYRFRLQTEKSQAILLLVTQAACASSCASVVLRCLEADERWQYANEASIGLPLLTGFCYQVSADRKRGSAQESFYLCKKKPVSVAETFWNGTTLWAR
ncbi:MAG: recombinase RecA [Acidobacteriia bacterium]|nr:recombinase RecA [Terriglobia bacterium]